MQTDATLLANSTQHYWARHVSSVCMEPQQCWHLLVLVAYSLKPVKLLGPANGRNIVDQKNPNNTQQCCCVRLHGPQVYTLLNKAISSDRLSLRQIATAAFNLRTWDSDTRIGAINISSATESKKIATSCLKTNYLDISISALLHVLK